MFREIPESLIHEYGEPGSPIIGSRLVRAYCDSCGGPMRACRQAGKFPIPLINFCTDCDNKHTIGGGGRRKVTEDDTGVS